MFPGWQGPPAPVTLDGVCVGGAAWGGQTKGQKDGRRRSSCSGRSKGGRGRRRAAARLGASTAAAAPAPGRLRRPRTCLSGPSEQLASLHAKSGSPPPSVLPAHPTECPLRSRVLGVQPPKRVLEPSLICHFSRRRTLAAGDTPVLLPGGGGVGRGGGGRREEEGRGGRRRREGGGGRRK